MPHHHLAPRNLPLALLGLGALALLPAATCDNQDYRALQTLTLATKAGSPPDAVVVSHPYSGRNTVDFALYNTGSLPMEVLLTATTVRSADELTDAGIPDTPNDAPADVTPDDPGDAPSAPSDLSLDLPINLDGGPRDGGILDLDLGFDVGDAADAGDTSADDPDTGDAGEPTPDDTPTTTAQQKILLGPGETRFGRFGEEDGLLGVSLNLEVECLSEICEGRLEFVVLLARLDCTQDADCASGELCEGRIGRCVPDPNADGCQSSPRRPAAPLALVLLLLLPLLARARRKAPLAALALTTLALTASPTPAHAGRAVFEFPTAHLSFDGKYQTWTGALGEQAGAGLGFDVTQALQYRYLGFQVGVGTSYFLTNPQAPPLARGLQTYNLKLGPRFVLPLWDFQLLADLEYQRLGVISNSLVRLTGPGLSYHGAGLGLSGRAFFGPLFVDLRLGYTQVFGFQEGSAGVFTLSLSAGIFGRL